MGQEAKRQSGAKAGGMRNVLRSMVGRGDGAYPCAEFEKLLRSLRPSKGHTDLLDLEVGCPSTS